MSALALRALGTQELVMVTSKMSSRDLNLWSSWETDILRS